MVSAWAAENRLVLAQVAVDEKSNEITAIPELLKLLALEGCIVTIDAIGTQRAIAAQIIEQNGDYALALKENQGNLYENVKDTFALACKDHFRDIEHQFYESIEKDHGRLEIRKHWMIDDLEQLTYLDQEGRWKGLQAIGMVVSERRIGLEVTTETRYYLLSFAREVQRFATSIRSHWGIENSVHWVLDVAFREDEPPHHNQLFLTKALTLYYSICAILLIIFRENKITISPGKISREAMRTLCGILTSPHFTSCTCV